jgi:hypothetical protein
MYPWIDFSIFLNVGDLLIASEGRPKGSMSSHEIHCLG